MPQIINSIGLLLDIFGVVLLFRYGLPSNAATRLSITHIGDEGRCRVARIGDEPFCR